MKEIVPRWEWRWFGHRFGPAESRLAALTPGGVQQSSETYLLSGDGDNVKVRDALMDIKVLREVNHDGLEQWTPVMKAGFPLPADEVTKVFAALRLDRRRCSGRATISRSSSTVAVPRAASARSASETPGPLHGRRVHGRAFRGRCRRQADAHDRRRIGRRRRRHRRRPQTWLDRLREHQLPARPGLHWSTAHRVAMPSSTSARTRSSFTWRSGRPAGARAPSSTGPRSRGSEKGSTKAGRIGDAALERAVTAIKGMADEAHRHGVLAIVAVGTAGLRIAGNRDEVLARPRSAPGFASR